MINFADLMVQMNFTYIGVDGRGNMISDQDITSVVVPQNNKNNQEYSMNYLIEQGFIKFYKNSWNQVKNSRAID